MLGHEGMQEGILIAQGLKAVTRGLQGTGRSSLRQPGPSIGASISPGLPTLLSISSSDSATRSKMEPPPIDE